MLVVLEGPEKAGKTTVARHIMANLRKSNIVYRRHIKGDSNHQTIMNDLDFALSHPDDLIIFDRWWPSELVYRPFDGEPNTVPLSYPTLEARYGGLADAAGVRIMVLPTLQVLQKRREVPDPTDIPIPVEREYQEYSNMLPTGKWWHISAWTPDMATRLENMWDGVLDTYRRWPTFRSSGAGNWYTH